MGLDLTLIPDGRQRTSSRRFGLSLLPWLGLLAFGLAGAVLCLGRGLNQTAMNDYFPFGLWIFFDLAVIALGAGAFFTGFLLYLMGRGELKSIINLAVIIGFICYSAAAAMLLIDIGQPLRAWFIFWHANMHSMLTEVAFCLTIYLVVLSIEYLPIILRNSQLDRVPEFRSVARGLHESMFLLAALGTFLSFFHQGSLGGMFGVMFARPFSARSMWFIWPTTFGLFILSAIAAGPCFVLLIAALLEKIGHKKLVRDEARQTLARIAGRLLAMYMVFKLADTLFWIFGPARAAGLSLTDFYRAGPYGLWTLFLELGLLGLVPAVILNIPAARRRGVWLILGCLLTCAGIVMNRFVMVVVTLAIPVLPFERFIGYLPSWPEWALALGAVGYGGLIISLSYRYLPLFPHERELNP